MKKIQYIKYVFIGCFAAMMFACNTLDVPPMNVVKDSEVFGDKSGVDAYMARLYIQLPLVDQQNNSGVDNERLSALAITENVNNTNPGNIGYINWNGIREASYFIQEFPNYKGNFNEVYANAWLGEAYFVRAFIFFQMVKGYGGLPIVQRVLNYPEESIEDLRLPRDKEDDCYAAILSDLDKAIELLPETSTTDVGLAQGRVNKYAALAMKSRVALWAASIAKYGKATLAPYSGDPAVVQGVVGVPENKANEYYELALTTAKSIVSSGRFELYGINIDDPEALKNSYRQMYLDRGAENKEIIFAKYYKYPESPEGVDGNCLPPQFGGGYERHLCPTLEFVKLYDDVNGNTVNWENLLGNDANYSSHLFENPADAFANMEPRFKATILYPNAEYKGVKTEIRKGILEAGAFVDGGTFDEESPSFLLSVAMNNYYNDMRIQGASGMGAANSTSTGFYLLKYATESFTLADATANPSKGEAFFPEIRYAEVLLNIAEAAIELGRPAEAVQPMNEIRKRAGSKKVFTAENLTLEKVRNDRLVELIWENKSHWDLKRWRQLHVRYDNTTFGLMWPIYIWDKNAYYLRLTDSGATENKRVTYNPRDYYLAIGGNDLSANMIQNPGY
jgi:hypothetical protein